MDNELEQKINKHGLKTELKGYRYFLYRTYSSSGNQQNYLSYNGLISRGGKIEQGTDLNVKVSMGDTMTLEGNYYELPYQERDLKFEMKKGKYMGLFGEFGADFRSGSLAVLNKKISGAELQYTDKKFKADWITSNTKSNSRTISFSGDNTHGPFSIDAFQILENSENVKINGQLVQADSYSLDYYSGQITFCKPNDPTVCRQIKSSDSVQISFEEKMLLALSGGAINAMSAKYDINKNFSLGAAGIVQEANRATQKTRSSGSYSITGDQLAAQSATDVIQIPSTGNIFPGYRFLSTNNSFISVSKNGAPLTFGTGFTIEYRGYLLGRIKILEPYLPQDTYSVNYTYYVQDPSLIGEVREEKLTGNGADSTFNLSQSQTGMIYPGSETVYYCTTPTCNPQSAILLSSDEAKEQNPPAIGDYIITSDRNQIKITNAAYLPNDSLGRYVKLVSYLTVPYSSPQSSAYNHTVTELYGNARVGPVDVSFELGQSSSDISKTPIQVLHEKVSVAQKTFVCPSVLPPPADCVLRLFHTDITDSSERISLNTSDTALVRGVNYTLQYDTGVLVLTGNTAVATQTIIYADYRFNPPIEAGIKTGNAQRFSAKADLKKYSINLVSEKTDTFFAPINGNNSLETSRFDIGVIGNPMENLSFELSSSNFDTAEDIAELTTVSNNSSKAALSYRRGRKSFSFSTFSDSSNDNKPTPGTDSERSGNDFTIGFDELWKTGPSVSYSVSSEDFTDNTATIDNTSSSSGILSMKYKRGETFNVTAVLSSIKQDSSGVSAEPFSNKNDSRNIVLTYMPLQLVTLTADIDHQRKTDSRPTQGASGKESSNISLTTLPIGKFRTISFSMVNQTYPSTVYDNSAAKTSNLTFTYVLTPALAVTPSYTLNKTQALNSSSNSNRKSVKLDYRPYQKKYELTVTKEFGDMSSQSSGSYDSSSSQLLTLDAKYKINEKTDFIYRFDQTQEDTTTINKKSLTQSYRFAYKPREKAEMSLVYSTIAQNDYSSSSRSNLSFESQIALSKIMTWRAQIQKISYSNSLNQDQGFDGKYMETELRAKF